jgi:hypothetical protein
MAQTQVYKAVLLALLFVWSSFPLLLTRVLAHVFKNSRGFHGLFCLCKQKCAVIKPWKLPLENSGLMSTPTRFPWFSLGGGVLRRMKNFVQ